MRRHIIIDAHLIRLRVPVQNVLDLIRRAFLLPGSKQGPVRRVSKWRGIVDLLPLVRQRKSWEELRHPLEQNPANLLFYKMVSLEIRNHDVNARL